MESLGEVGSVQQKISCIFETAVLEEQSNKRSYQQYKVVAVDNIKQKALADGIARAKATEKIDGTCVYIAEFQGRPWVWARLDRKPNKAIDKKFKKFQQQKQKWISEGKNGTEPKFSWNIETDFREVPEYWIPALGVPILDGQPLPDDNGHIPGWVPLEKQSKQYVWHLSAVDLDSGIGLILREDENSEDLVVEVRELVDFIGHTAELIGTNVNANPYNIGNKKTPLHFLVIHGTIKVQNPPELRLGGVQDWFEATDSCCGHVEGVVWHCSSGVLYKIHRHHLNLKWPLKEPRLSCRKVHIMADISAYSSMDDKKSIIRDLSKFKGQNCASLMQMVDLLSVECEKG